MKIRNENYAVDPNPKPPPPPPPPPEKGEEN